MDLDHASALGKLQVTYRVTFESASHPQWGRVSFDREFFSPHLQYWARQGDNRHYGTSEDLFLSTPTRLPERPPTDLEAAVSIVVNDGHAEHVLPWRSAGTVVKSLLLKRHTRRNEIDFSKGACMWFNDQQLQKIEMPPLRDGEPSLWDLLQPFAHRHVLKRRRDTLAEEIAEAPAKRRRIDEEYVERVAQHEQRQKDAAASLVCIEQELAQ